MRTRNIKARGEVHVLRLPDLRVTCQISSGEAEAEEEPATTSMLLKVKSRPPWPLGHFTGTETTACPVIVESFVFIIHIEIQYFDLEYRSVRAVTVKRLIYTWYWCLEGSWGKWEAQVSSKLNS